MPPHTVWTARRERAARLCGGHPPAAQLLAFYGDVLALQEPLYAKALGSRWLRAVEADDGVPPRLRLARLPERPRDRAFSRFVRAVPASATDVLRAAAARLASEPAAMAELLRAALEGETAAAVAASLDCEAAALAFFPRAFLQPIAEALARAAEGGVAGAARVPAGDGQSAFREDAARVGGPAASREDAAGAACPSCPYCGDAPVAAVLRDLPDARGRRTLLCSLCLSERPFPRTRCPACGEERADRRPHHVSESWPHIRLEECGSCRTYVKAIDLREDGRAVPVVDELASVELDLWAAGQGLSKRRTNLLGL